MWLVFSQVLCSLLPPRYLSTSLTSGDIIINLMTCRHRTKPYDDALKALEYVSLTFSCLFVLELIASIWAFGKAYAPFLAPIYLREPDIVHQLLRVKVSCL